MKLCIDILNKSVLFFSKMEYRNINKALSGSRYQWEEGAYMEREYRMNMVEILSTHVRKWKTRPVETILEWEEGK
jgi:hypothetical protein